MIIGSHIGLSAPKYLETSVLEAVSYGANALMIYTGAPQNTKRKDVSQLHIEQGHQYLQEYGILKEHLIVHAPYIINLANYIKEDVGELATQFLQQEIERTKALQAKYIVLHPGSYTTGELNVGLETIIERLNQLEWGDSSIQICLETMAGKGSEIGYTFEQLASILRNMKHPEHFGVCFDTCHTWDAGYDLHDFDHVIQHFDEVIGLTNLKVIHLNDSKNILGARKDRHENIGKGYIGKDTLCQIAHHPLLQVIPKILETPYIDQKAPYRQEIEMIKEYQG